MAFRQLPPKQPTSERTRANSDAGSTAPLLRRNSRSTASVGQLQNQGSATKRPHLPLDGSPAATQARSDPKTEGDGFATRRSPEHKKAASLEIVQQIQQRGISQHEQTVQHAGYVGFRTGALTGIVISDSNRYVALAGGFLGVHIGRGIGHLRALLVPRSLVRMNLLQADAFFQAAIARSPQQSAQIREILKKHKVLNNQGVLFERRNMTLPSCQQDLVDLGLSDNQVLQVYEYLSDVVALVRGTPSVG